MINGVINVYKEKGFTSHDVVAKLRGIAGQRKIGHTGTLDPEAEGVLPVCLGNATKLCDMLTEETKEYRTQLLLGVTTDTLDMTGTVTDRREVTAGEKEIREAVLSFVGGYEQIPPMYSALKINGQKLYELARAGREVERKPRHVEIPSIEILELKQPFVTMKITCSKGTYIRSLCQDIGEALGCGGTMQSLVRSRVGRFTLEEAKRLSELQEMKDTGVLQEAVHAVDMLFVKFPGYLVKPEGMKLLENGNALPDELMEREISSVNSVEQGKIRVYGQNRKFYGIYEWNGREERFKPVKMFLEREE